MFEHNQKLSRNSIFEFLKITSQNLVFSNEHLGMWGRNYVDHHMDRFIDDIMLALRICGNRQSLHIADVGSTPPMVSAYLASLGHKVTAIDLDPYRVKLSSSHNLSLYKYDIEFADADRLPGELYDLILFNEVIEHLRISLPNSIKKLRESLAPRGHIIFSTPNLWSYRGILNFLFKRRAEVLCSKPEIEYSKLSEIGHMGHVREYTYYEIQSLLEYCGFCIVETNFRQYSYQASMFEILLTNIFPRLRNNVAITVNIRDNKCQ